MAEILAKGDGHFDFASLRSVTWVGGLNRSGPHGQRLSDCQLVGVLELTEAFGEFAFVGVIFEIAWEDDVAFVHLLETVL